MLIRVNKKQCVKSKSQYKFGLYCQVERLQDPVSRLDHTQFRRIHLYATEAEIYHKSTRIYIYNIYPSNTEYYYNAAVSKRGRSEFFKSADACFGETPNKTACV